jgi:hypothetical protein
MMRGGGVDKLPVFSAFSAQDPCWEGSQRNRLGHRVFTRTALLEGVTAQIEKGRISCRMRPFFCVLPLVALRTTCSPLA